MRAVHRCGNLPCQRQVFGPRGFWRQHDAGFAHFGFAESFQYGHRLWSTAHDNQAFLQDGNAGRFRDLVPHIARAHGAAPAFAALLAGDCDEPEIADRSPHSLFVTVDDHGPKTLAGGRERMSKADNSSPDNRDIVLQKHCSGTGGTTRFFIAFYGE